LKKNNMLQQDRTTPRRVLVIVAHPDDIEFGVAGSVTRWVDEGAHVTYCIVTDGAAGSNEPGTDLAKLTQQRREEQINAAAVAGVQDVRFLGHRDGVLQPTMDLRRELTRLIREVRPDRVVCQDPTTVFVRDEYVNHPDHRAAGASHLP
jgi:LmbE family N-acetylglucosaminyl deacetylase